MKNTFKLFLFAFIFLLFGCNQDEAFNTNNGSQEPPVAAAHISTTDIVEYLPEEYLQNRKAMYKDRAGNEKLLNSAFIESKEERTEFGRTYSHDRFLVRLFDESDTDFMIEVDGYGLYTQSGEVQKVIGAILMPMNPTGSSSVSVLFEDGQPIVTQFDDFRETVSFFGKSFEKVYLSISTFSVHDSFSEIHFNFTEGVVAFRDKNDEMWIFDRFIE